MRISGLEQPARNRGVLDWCHPLVRELYEYWDSKRHGRLMPCRKDIDPSDFPRHLPGIVLVDVREGAHRFVYRVVGTRDVEARGFDPTGRSVSDHFFGKNQEDAINCYESVVKERTCLLDLSLFSTDDGRYRKEQTLFLPLSENRETVSQILVYAHLVKLR